MSNQPTSSQSFEAIKKDGLLNRLQFLVYEALYASTQPLTQKELWHHYLGEQHLLNSINTRFAELVKLGVIEACGERKCQLTGKLSLVYRVKPGLPVKPQGEQKQSKVAVLRQELEDSRKEAIGLRRECAAKALEILALKAKLAKWGRPTNEERARRQQPAAINDLPLDGVVALQ